MKNQLFKTPECGNIGIIAAIIIVAALFMWQIWKPEMISQSSESGEQSCRPENGSKIKIDIEDGSGPQDYTRIKTDGLIEQQYIDAGSPDYDGRHLKLLAQQLGSGSDTQELYLVYNTERIPFERVSGGMASFDPNGLVYATQKEPYSLQTDGRATPTYFIDVYRKSDQPLPPEVYDCKDNQIGKISPTIVFPSIDPSANNKQIQIRNFTVSKANYNSYYTIHCKPIIYLYPEQKETVSVKLNPKGSLLETIPTYPQEGWIVTAYPDGRIDYQNKTYPYLYYESKIFDSEVKVPSTGYVRSYIDLQALFSFILPQMGLDESEAKEFSDYWQIALPYAPYYFVGFMDSTSIDHIEPLTISPKPDTIIRVRAYFKALEKPIDVSEPKLFVPSNREGFTVVEWGGMVKTDMNHPFTCSQ